MNELFLKSGIYKNDCDANELRKLLIRREIPDFVDMEKIYGLALKVLDLAKEGLLERDLGEEVFLDSLYDNLNNRTNPGKRLLDSLDGGKSLEEIIKEYGEVE